MPNTEVKTKSKPKSGSKPFIHVVAGLIRHPENFNSIFITRRSKGQHLENLWEFPGGKVELQETRFHALRRELMEETGIHVLSARPFQTAFHRYEEKNIHLDVWEVLKFSGEAHGSEGQEAHWVNIKDLGSYEFPEADQSLLKAVALPNELLITPDFPEHDLENNVLHLDRLLTKHRYDRVVFRGHHLSDENYLSLAKEMSAICTKKKSSLIITRPTLKSIQQDMFQDFKHIHINSYSLPSIHHSPFDNTFTLSASCHDRAELTMAAKLNVAFALLSTVRETLSHPGRKAKGWYQFKHLAHQAQIPVYALGGVVRKDFHNSRYQGAIGVAGISDFWTV